MSEDSLKKDSVHVESPKGDGIQGGNAETAATETAAEVAAPAGETPPPAETVAEEPSLAAQLAAAVEAQKATHDRLLRTAADFDNYRKRSRREQTDAVEQAENRVVLDFLPILDNLERAIDHADAGASPLDESLIGGVKMVQKQFLTTLGRYGVEAVEAMGKPFDPELHEAIQQQASDLPAHMIIAELQKGYRRSNRLVRPAMVVISLGPEKAARDGGGEAGGQGTCDTGTGDVGTQGAGTQGASDATAACAAQTTCGCGQNACCSEPASTPADES